MPIGSVVRFDPRRGYGFVVPDDGDQDVFVHQNDITMDGFRYLLPGERVNFELEVGEKGMKAVGVELVEPRPDRDRRERDRSQNNGHNDRQQGERYNKRSHNSYDDSPRSESDDRAGRRLERLVSLLVAKGVLAPGEIDELPLAAASDE